LDLLFLIIKIKSGEVEYFHIARRHLVFFIFCSQTMKNIKKKIIIILFNTITAGGIYTK